MVGRRHSFRGPMQSHAHFLHGDSAGTGRSVTACRFGTVGQGRKAYLQAGLHADEMPGILILHHLIADLTLAEAEGRLRGEIIVVPLANPIGLAQWAYHKPLGRMETESMQNFNRHYPDLAELAGDALEAVLTPSPERNTEIIRRAFRDALDRMGPRSDIDELRLTLLKWSFDADYVLDLHCDHDGIVHFYAPTERLDESRLLGRSIGAELAMLEEDSGAHSFDEANSAPWARLRRRFEGRFPIPQACYAATLEYRGQFDVDDATARTDASNLMTYLAAIGIIDGGDVPAHAEPLLYPLGGAVEVHADEGGVVVWEAQVGAMVAKDQVLGHVMGPVTGDRIPFASPIDGMMFRRELWRSCLRGQELCHVAGAVALGPGKTLGD